ncbi:MAG: hypothetical protein ACT4PL_05020 [Phycisphaerales bacterium]
MTSTLLFLCLAPLSVSLAITEPPATEPPAAEDVLAGPRTTPAAPARPTLVARGFNGELLRLNEHPAVGAARLLKLETSALTEVERILVDRAATLDRMVADNIDFLLELGTKGAAAKDGTPAQKHEATSLVLRALTKLSEINRAGALEVRLRRAIPRDRRAEFDALVREYFDAVGEDGVVEDGVVVRKGNAVESAISETFRLLGKEVERSFQRLVGDGEKEFENLLAALDLKPAQEQKIRALVEEFFGKTKFKPTEGQQALLFLRIIDTLEPPQRISLGKLVREAEGKGKPATTAKPAQPTTPAQPAPVSGEKPAR